MVKNESQFVSIRIIFPVASLGEVVEIEKRLKEALSTIPAYRWDLQHSERKGPLPDGGLVNTTAMPG